MLFVLSADRNISINDSTSFKDVLELISLHEERSRKEEELRSKMMG